MFGSDKEGKNAVAVALTLTSGEVEKGQLHVGITGKLCDAMNKPGPFVELIKPDGSTELIAKSVIARIVPVIVPRIDQLSKRLEKDEGMPDPHSVLSVSKTARDQDIRDAYHALAKRYHPDRFSDSEMPSEVLEYVSSMFMRITTAYNELKTANDQSQAA